MLHQTSEKPHHTRWYGFSMTLWTKATVCLPALGGQ